MSWLMDQDLHHQQRPSQYNYNYRNTHTHITIAVCVQHSYTQCVHTLHTVQLVLYTQPSLQLTTHHLLYNQTRCGTNTHSLSVCRLQAETASHISILIDTISSKF